MTLADSQFRQSLIPGGGHTYSRGDDTFPASAPGLLVRGKGAYVWDTNGKKYLDWAMAVRSVSVGHAHRPIDNAAYRLSRRGVNLSRPTPEEFLLAGRILDLIPGAEMVKFGKNGSDATAAAIRLSRSVTGRDIVLRSDQSQFLGVHDWFIGSTTMNRGVPKAVSALTQVFRYDDIPDLHRLFKENRNQVAAVVLEPLGQHIPQPDYLEELIELAHANGALVVFDEVVSGFRVGIGGYQGLTGIAPDLSAFGKAFANGYPLSALVGKAKYMERAGTRHDGPRTFIMSSTYGPERSSIGAALATLDFMENESPFEENQRIMLAIVQSILSNLEKWGLTNRLNVSGMEISPNLSFLGPNGEISLALKTAFMEGMLKYGILLGNHLFSVAACHRRRELLQTISAIPAVVQGLAERIEDIDSGGPEFSHIVKPVFREWN